LGRQSGEDDSVNIPVTRYAKSGDLHIAYQAVGEGPPDVVLTDQWFSHVEAQWDFPPLARLLGRLASFSRVLTFDARGIGLSDPVALTSLPSIEEWMDDLRAALDAAGSERAAVVAGMAAGLMAILFAATYPERVSALVLVNCYARLVQTRDYPAGESPEREGRERARARTSWGRGMLLDMFAPSMADDASSREGWARYERHAASPGTAIAMLDVIWGSDLRHVLPTVRVPTLVISRGERVGHGRYLATHIQNARYVELPGKDSFIWAGDMDSMVSEIQEFVTGVRPAPEPDRVLATVLFTDIVGSTQEAARVGDRRWREVIQSHNTVVRRELERFRGREVHGTGDGVLAMFDGPARAIRSAVAISEAVRPLGIEVRAGLHTGEIELLPNDIGGIAVHIGSRVSSAAGPREVLVSSTVKDLVAGSGIEFEDRGLHELKGVPGQWHLFAVTTT
jgi:class 3 adenylate cyclase/pimeloyl-ACP methyl ester carboxylesterase